MRPKAAKPTTSQTAQEARDKRRQLGLDLAMHRWVRFNIEKSDAKPRYVLGVDSNGMVEVKDMSGLFAPSLFTKADPPTIADAKQAGVL